jgi:CDP-diacylglycerol pyrophosphatase
MLSKPFVMLRSGPAKPGRVSKHAQRGARRILPQTLRLAALRLVVTVLLGAGMPSLAHADPDALWKIVDGLCVPNEVQHGLPAPCTRVDLKGGYAVLKDIKGRTQYLVIPTARVTGIEDPALLQPGTPNYFADAWRERGYTERAAGRPLPRDALSLAVNSVFARSQNQLHIHIDCLRRDVRTALRRLRNRIGGAWARLPRRLAGHRYWAMRVRGADLDGADPFQLLAANRPGAGAAMGEQTLVVAGALFAGRRPGFILLNDRVNLAIGDHAGGEELQDHACALARN